MWLFNGSSLVDEGDNLQGSSMGLLLASLSDQCTYRLCTYFFWYEAMKKLCLHIDSEDEVVSFHREREQQDLNNVISLTLAFMMPYAVPFCSVHVYPPQGFMDGMMYPHTVWGVQGNLASNNALESQNGSIVGFCWDPDAYDNVHCHPSCNAKAGIPVINCIGLGIIRSIN